ncbi:MAG: hypothetical protein WAP56_10060 [Acetivibrionales bacterium]|nr:hypothetical protein [Bacillota bacterium]NLP08081.1 hypothetical protein [Clostridiaceae bacterium]HOA55806.1 hypothetical protein [Clostridiales bacterium]HPZ06045.1 hypothetical protein [Clostridiales bacterium]HQD30941.1 hypothetical protein [Clostridiales bacterium]
MAVFNNFSGKLRTMFDEGLDEVLIFAIIFIVVLLSGNESCCSGNMGFIPLIIIGVFLLLFASTCRSDETAA